MTMFGLLGSSVSGIKAQNAAIANVSDNLANASTLGYKGTDTSFYSLVTDASVGGGVRPYNSKTVDIQGSLVASPVNTHLAIAGDGMFAVQLSPESGSQQYFTRSGAFSPDAHQNLVNGEGAYLVGWKIEEGGATESPVIGDLEVINLKDLGMTAVATSEIRVGMNLDAEETAVIGKPVELSFTSAENRYVKMDDPIVADSNVRVGDGFTLSLDSGLSHSFRYGGVVSSAKVSSDNPVFGARAVDDVFKTLEDGDQFIINTDSTGDVVFTFSRNAPDIAGGYFNSLSTLARSVDLHKDFSSRLVADRVVITPNKAYDKISFSNVERPSGFADRITVDATYIYGNDVPLNTINSFVISPNMGLYGAIDANTAFSTGINPGAQINMRLSDGREYDFVYDATVSASGKRFNSLATLANALNTVEGINANIINGNQLQCRSQNAVVSLTSDDGSMVAENLGMAIHSTFKNKVTAGDKMKLEVGAFNKVDSTGFAIDDVIGSYTKVVSNDLFKVPGLGIAAVTDKFSGLSDGDGFKLITSAGAGGYNFTYKGAGLADPTQGQFDSLQTLSDAVNSFFPGANSSISGGNLYIAAPSGQPLNEVRSLGSGVVLDALGWAFGQPAVNDTFDVALDSGEKWRFSFSGAATPDPSAAQFNTVKTLQDLILNNTDGKLDAQIIDDRIVITPVKGSLGGTINSISGAVAHVLGMERKTQVAEVKFVQGNPDVKAGEFNDFLSLSQAISEGIDLLDARLDDQGHRMQMTLGDGAQLKYIDDLNIVGRSDFATKLGIRGADIVAGLGLVDTVADTERETFSTMQGLNSLLSLADGVEGKVVSGDRLGIVPENVLEVLSFANLTENKGPGSFTGWLGLPSEGFAPAYDPMDSAKNMANGRLAPHYFHSVRVYDTLGSDHEVRFAFAKLDENKWAMEIFTPDPHELDTDRADGLIASAFMDFGGDGLLTNVDFKPVFAADQDGSVNVAWTNGSNPSDVKFDLGFKFGEGADPKGGVRQFSAQYMLEDFAQDGYGIGSMTRFDIDDSGYVIANFSNGVNRKVYQIPIAEFANMNGLQIVAGTMYQQSFDSGPSTLKAPGAEGAAIRLMPNTLEGSNVQMFDQLVNMITSRHVHQSNLKVLQVMEKMLDDVSKII